MTLASGRVGELQAAPYTYRPVGLTRDGTVPAGFRRDQYRRVLARRDFAGAVADLMGWQLHGRAGVRVAASAPVAAPGVLVEQRIGRGPLSVVAPCRVVYVVDEPDRQGFAYGTLRGHPEAGEELFVLERRADGRIELVVTAVSRPAWWLARLGRPVSRVVQRRVTARYLAALDDPPSAPPTLDGAVAARLVPAGSAERFVTVDGGRVRVIESTATPGPDRVPLLLVHGGGTDSAAISWFHLYASFGGERRVVGLDLPGFGGTGGIPPLGGAAEQADFVARVAARLGIERAVVVGVSMGGEVALQLALRHPDRVERLVLVAPGGLVGVLGHRGALQLAAWLTAQLPDRVLVPLTRLANRFAGAALRAMVRDPDRLPPEVVAEFVREARAPGAGLGYLRYNQANLGPWSMRNNLLPAVHRITAPTLLFHGEDDPLVDPEGSRQAGRLLRSARVVLVPDCGHWAQLEAPERFLAEVRRFLGTGDAPG